MEPIRFADVPDVYFQLVDKEHHRQILYDFLLDFFRVQEPITSSLGTSREDVLDFYTDLVAAGLKDTVSYGAFSAQGDLIGCRLNEISIVEGKNRTCQDAIDTKKNESKSKSSPIYKSINANKIAGFIDELMDNYSQLLPVNCEKLMKFVVVGVRPDYFRKGIGTKLVELSLQKAKQQNCDYVITTATALKSQNLFAKLGFVTLREIDYHEYVVDGDRVFKHLHDGATCGKLMGIQI